MYGDWDTTNRNLPISCGQGGIGEALVKEYARRGIRPIATILPSESSDHLAGIQWFPLDVTQEASIIELKSMITSITGGFMDILINNALVLKLPK